MLSDLAFALAKDAGTRISIITSRQRYDVPGVSLPSTETIAGVEVCRVWTSRFGRQNLIGRAVDYATFYVSSARAIWRLARRGDIVVAKTDPPMLSVVAAPIAWARGAKLVNWLQDVFPEVAEGLGLGAGAMSKAIYGPLRWLRNWSLRRAAVNVALGDRMAATLAKNGIAPERTAIIPNWADGEAVVPIAPKENALRTQWGLQNTFVVGYSGNLGRAHDIQTLLAAIELLETRAASPSISWLFIGGGALYNEFSGEVTRRNFKSVHLRPYQPRERLAESLSVADVHLVSLRPELEGLIVPSKFYGVAASGRPTVFIGDEAGEISTLIAKYGCGRQVSENDSAGLARVCIELADDQALCQAMGEVARKVFLTEFDKPIAVARWRQLLSKVSKERG